MWIHGIRYCSDYGIVRYASCGRRMLDLWENGDVYGSWITGLHLRLLFLVVRFDVRMKMCQLYV